MARMTFGMDGPSAADITRASTSRGSPCRMSMHALGDEVRLAADVAREEPDDASEHGGDDRRAQSHDEGNAGPVQDAGVDVAPEVVCPEPVGGARGGEGGRGVGGDGIVGLQHVGEDGREHDKEHDEAARRAQRLLAAEAEQRLRPARIRRAHGGRHHHHSASCHSAPAGRARRRACPRRDWR